MHELRLVAPSAIGLTAEQRLRLAWLLLNAVVAVEVPEPYDESNDDDDDDDDDVPLAPYTCWRTAPVCGFRWHWTWPVLEVLREASTFDAAFIEDHDDDGAITADAAPWLGNAARIVLGLDELDDESEMPDIGEFFDVDVSADAVHVQLSETTVVFESHAITIDDPCGDDLLPEQATSWIVELLTVLTGWSWNTAALSASTQRQVRKAVSGCSAVGPARVSSTSNARSLVAALVDAEVLVVRTNGEATVHKLVERCLRAGTSATALAAELLRCDDVEELTLNDDELKALLAAW